METSYTEIPCDYLFHRGIVIMDMGDVDAEFRMRVLDLVFAYSVFCFCRESGRKWRRKRKGKIVGKEEIKE